MEVKKNTLKEENGTRGSRGPLLQWGNIFVREDSYENPVLYRKAVAEFLGNSRPPKKPLSWRGDILGCLGQRILLVTNGMLKMKMS